MSYADVVEDAERRTRRKFYNDLIARLTVVPDPSDEAALETYEYHVGDLAWAAHLMANVCGQQAVLDTLRQLTQQLSESEYWIALETEKENIRRNVEEMKDEHPLLWEHYREMTRTG